MAAGASWVRKITRMVGIAMISRMTANAMVQRDLEHGVAVHLLGDGRARAVAEAPARVDAAPTSTAMKMPRVHHEISMKIPCVSFPKSDFGITVLIGVSQFQPTALQARRQRDHGPGAGGERRGDAVAWSWSPLAGRGARRLRRGTVGDHGRRHRGPAQSKTATQLRAARKSTSSTGMRSRGARWAARASCADSARRERSTKASALAWAARKHGQDQGQQQVHYRGHNFLMGKVISGSARSVLERSPAAKWNVSQ